MKLNQVFIAGNLTRDPEVRYTTKGSAVANIDMAINHTVLINREPKEQTTFVKVEVWGKSAEAAGKFLSKGSPLFVEGYLRLDTWEKNGEKRASMKVVAQRLQFIGPKREERPKVEDAGDRPANAGPDLADQDEVF